MNSRKRLQLTLDHQQPDRVAIDFGASFITGMHVSIVHQLRQRLLGDHDYLVKVIEPYQMLGEVDDKLRKALNIDVVGVAGRKSLLGTEAKDWKPWKLQDGTCCLVPGNFNVTPAPDGGWYMHPGGDTRLAPSAHMPGGGYFFDTIVRQDPIDEEKLNVEDNLEEFGLLGPEDLATWQERKRWLKERSDYGGLLSAPGTAFGDIALVPAPWMPHPKGIRDIAEWYISTRTRRDYVWAIFEKQCEYALRNLKTLIDLLGDLVQVVILTGTDFGTQRGPFISPAAYRDLYKPFHKQLNDFVHKNSSWKTFIHSCGSVYQLLPDFIDAGFDILNPVQCSAAEMEAPRLKREFGSKVVFWGGGVDTQKTIAFGTPDQVRAEVRQRVEIFSKGGGFVFNAIHNVQGNTPIENVLAMFEVLHELTPAG